MRLWVTAAIAVALGALAACSDGDPGAVDKRATPSPPTAATSTSPIEATSAVADWPEVVETFNVGNNVYVRSLAADSEHNSLWVGTSIGVLEIDLATNEPRNTFTREHGLANEYVFAIGLDSRGYKWFGTNAGGVSRYRDGEWSVYFPMHGLADYWVYSFANQSDDIMWIGTWAGVNRVDLTDMSFKTYVKELVNEWVYAIDVDSSGRVWFGTEGGISMFDGTQWRQWTHEDGMGAANATSLPASANTGLGTRSRHDLTTMAGASETFNPNYVFALEAAPDDTIWVGTWGGGVARFDGKSWVNLTMLDGLAGNVVYSVERDADGVFWFGTNHGLSRYDGQNWRTYTTREGLLGDDVYAIESAPNGEVWVGTKNGVARLGAKTMRGGGDNR